MQGPSHLLLSWYFADAAALPAARDRRIVAWSGLAPDVDVVAYVGALAYYRLDKDLAFENVWQVVHHRYTHNLAFVVVTAAIAFALASRERRARVAVLAAAAAAIHNFLDLVAGGPTWPIYPAWPLSDLAWSASWSWTIGEWPNLAVLFACLAGMFAYARFAGRSPVECFGDAAGAWFARTVRNSPPAAAARRGGPLRWIIWAGVVALAVAVVLPLVQQ